VHLGLPLSPLPSRSRASLALGSSRPGRHGTLAGVRRAGLIAVGAIGVVVVAGAATWLVVFRDTAEPVTVDEAVTSFRTDTEHSPGGPSPIPAGVYVYETDGFEKTDALTGVTHRYPKRTTITVTASSCGVSLLWRVLKGRSTEWAYCTTADGWELASQDERHTFFGRTERTTYTCEHTPIRPAEGAPHRWDISCSTGSADETGTGVVVGTERLRVGEKAVATEHVRRRTTFSGDIRGATTHDLWFDSESGLPVKMVMVTRTTNDSPIGDVHYEEQVSLLATSLEPRR